MEFKTGRSYTNREGTYKVLAVTKNKLSVRYDESGRKAELDATAQAQIIQNMAREQTPKPRRLPQEAPRWETPERLEQVKALALKHIGRPCLERHVNCPIVAHYFQRQPSRPTFPGPRLAGMVRPEELAAKRRLPRPNAAFVKPAAVGKRGAYETREVTVREFTDPIGPEMVETTKTVTVPVKASELRIKDYRPTVSEASGEDLTREVEARAGGLAKLQRDELVSRYADEDLTREVEARARAGESVPTGMERGFSERRGLGARDPVEREEYLMGRPEWFSLGVGLNSGGHRIAKVRVAGTRALLYVNTSLSREVTSRDFRRRQKSQGYEPEFEAEIIDRAVRGWLNLSRTKETVLIEDPYDSVRQATGAGAPGLQPERAPRDFKGQRTRTTRKL